MFMTEHSFAYENAQSYELRKLRVLDGSAARARADAKRIDAVKLALAVIAVLVYFLGLTFIEAKLTNAGAEINSIKAAIEDTQNASAVMDLKIGSLASLDRIEQYAINELGMVYPDAEAVYFLDQESSMNIVAGQAELTAFAQNKSDDEDVSHPFWGALSDKFHNFFGGTALAAE